MNKCAATRTLREVRANGTELAAGQLYDLILAATDDREAAETAARAKIRRELSAGLTPTGV